MDQVHDISEERFALLVAEFLGNPAVTPPSGKKFGTAGLKVHNKIFALLSRGKLVVKLPRQRVDALVATGAGTRFDPRQDGRLMKEWIVLESTDQEEWLALAQEALAFVGPRQ